MARRSARERIATAIADLPATWFALVMATGIVSIACSLMGLQWVGRALLAFNVAAYALLALLLIVRLVVYPRRILEDFADHGRGPTFFAVVAATCVLGSELFLVVDAKLPSRWLWIAGIGLWVVVMYVFLAAVVTRREKPSLAEGINGAWLIATVATQSVAVLGALLAPGFDEGRPLLLFFVLCMWLLGAMLYLTIITLIFYRFTFLALPLEGLTPPYWINMGAVAITTLAGDTLLLREEGWSVLADLHPFVLGFTLFFWATATWWIPLLILLGIWRHGVRRFPFRFDPSYWGMVFPLGMYTVATLRLAIVAELDFLLPIAGIFLWVAIVAWVAVFVGMLVFLGRRVRA